MITIINEHFAIDLNDILSIGKAQQVSIEDAFLKKEYFIHLKSNGDQVYKMLITKETKKDLFKVLNSNKKPFVDPRMITDWMLATLNKDNDE